MSDQNLRKNAKVDGAGMRRLTEHEHHDFAGIEGEPDEARIGELEMFGGIEAQVVLGETALGVYWYGPNDDLHAWQVDGLTRYVLEMIAAELMAWHMLHPRDDLNEATLERFGLERCA